VGFEPTVTCATTVFETFNGPASFAGSAANFLLSNIEPLRGSPGVSEDVAPQSAVDTAALGPSTGVVDPSEW
jgi:hypothetical protein